MDGLYAFEFSSDGEAGLNFEILCETMEAALTTPSASPEAFVNRRTGRTLSENWEQLNLSRRGAKPASVDKVIKHTVVTNAEGEPTNVSVTTSLQNIAAVEGRSLADKNFDLWVEGRVSQFEYKFDDGGGRYEAAGSAGAVNLGADYILKPGLMVGALAQFDRYSENYDAFGAASSSKPREQQVGALGAGLRLTLESLLPSASRVEVWLSSDRPRIYAFARGGEGAGALFEIPLVCDTLWIDADRSLCALSWRGVLTVDDPCDMPLQLVSTLAPTWMAENPAGVVERLRFAKIAAPSRCRISRRASVSAASRKRRSRRSRALRSAPRPRAWTTRSRWCVRLRSPRRPRIARWARSVLEGSSPRRAPRRSAEETATPRSLQMRIPSSRRTI